MSLPRIMSGVYLTRHGGPEALEMRHDIAVPAPGKGQVLVQVLAVGINNTDINTRLGWYDREVTTATDAVPQKAAIEAGGWGGALTFPRIQGGDICGRIVALGAEVDAFHIGQRVTCPINIPRPRPENKRAYEVLGSERDGAFAQYCVLDAVDLYDVSAAPLSDIEIAATPCAYGTAETLLTRAGVSKDQQIQAVQKRLEEEGSIQEEKIRDKLYEIIQLKEQLAQMKSEAVGDQSLAAPKPSRLKWVKKWFTSNKKKDEAPTTVS